MKTLSIDIGDTEWRAVEQRAARQAATVSELVRDFLKELAREENGEETRARKQLLALGERSRAVVGPVTWTRSDLHDR